MALSAAALPSAGNVQAAAQQGAGFVPACRGQYLHFYAQPLPQLFYRDIVKEGILFLPQHHSRDAQRFCGKLASALGDDVGSSDQAGHANITAEKAVLDGVDVHSDHGVLPVQLLHHAGNKGRCHGAGDHVQLLGAVDAVEWAKKVEALGAGEILLTSMDCDGTKAGYDLELTRTIAENVSIPVIASGGAGNLEHFYEALGEEGKADAALAASLFHYKELEIREVKEYLREKGVSVRL